MTAGEAVLAGWVLLLALVLVLALLNGRRS